VSAWIVRHGINGEHQDWALNHGRDDERPASGLAYHVARAGGCRAHHPCGSVVELAKSIVGSTQTGTTPPRTVTHCRYVVSQRSPAVAAHW
jgi:hypothetical protein